MKKMLLLIIIFITILLYYYNTNITKITQEIYYNESLELKSQLHHLINKKQGDTSALTYLISQDANLKEALLKNNNKNINFTQTIIGLNKNTRFQNIWVQVIDKNGNSFYRSWTKKVGDNLSNARVDIAAMIKNPKPMSQISTGKFDMTFKSIMPLYSEDNFIGMVEMITHFNSISKSLKEFNIEPIMIVDNSYTKKFIKPLTGLFIDDYYVANKNASQVLMDDIQKNDIKTFLNINDYIIFKDYLVTKYETKNLQNKNMGYHILFYKLNKIDMHKTEEFTLDLLIKFIIVSIFISLIIIVRINQSYLNKLNIKVYEKTKHIENQKKELSLLLNSYDTHVISSQTNKEGLITYASTALCDISGYSQEEILGQNHRIIRHPDMSDSLFVDLWETITAGKEWTGELKNLKKDGGYYWTTAKIAPKYDDENNLMGYTSIRHDITAQKDFEIQHKQLIESEKMASIGEMIGNIAHQWRQPLSVISTSATALILKEECAMTKGYDLIESCNNINKNAQYLSKTIDDFRNFISKDQELQNFNLNKYTESFLQLVHSTIKKENLTVITDLDSSINISGYPNELIQCFINIFNNAKDALIENNDVKNRYIFISQVKVNQHAEITFKDNAGGIPENIISKIFEPYFTTKHKSQGTGLGLNMTYNMINESMNGSIIAENIQFEHENNTFNGAQFTIKLKLI